MLLFEIAKFFHILLISVWIGGQLALPFIIVPAVKKHPDKETILVKIGIQFAKIGHYLLAFIFLTGLLTFYLKGFTFNLHTFLSGYGQLFSLKILVFLTMVGITIYHEKLTLNYYRSKKHNYKPSRLSGYAILLFSLMLIIIGIMLSNGNPFA